MIIADTSFLIAYFNIKNSQHTKAVIDMSSITQTKEIIQVNDLVLQEMLSLHSIKFDQNSQLHFIVKSILDGNSKNIIRHKHNKSLLEQIYKLVKNTNTKGLSFTNLSLILDMREIKTGKLLSYNIELCRYATENELSIYKSALSLVKIKD